MKNVKQFKDLNFKISVIGALHELGYYNEEVDKVLRENSEEVEDCEPIPSVLKFYKNLKIKPSYLAKIETLQPDGGDLCYINLFDTWDGGEDDTFDITTIEGIDNLINLKSFYPISMISLNGVDYSPLLLCKKLETVNSRFIIENGGAVLKELEGKGVKIIA